MLTCQVTRTWLPWCSPSEHAETSEFQKALGVIVICYINESAQLTCIWRLRLLL